ncbi:MAG: AAA family ATPase [Patescibacteria group bacterium]|jgi:ATP-dependent Clp protease ATP-binding subunit ClpA
MFSDYYLFLAGALVILAVFLLYPMFSRGRGKTAKGSHLSNYTTDWTEEAKAGKLDPVIGREEEIDRVIHILMRRRKNNPLLIGDPGVGKTAVIEGLAARIVSGDVPTPLKGKRILALDLTGMVSGTKYRGELEERVRNLTKEIEGLGRSVILFIDEMHIIEQTAGAEGALNVSDILKPTLARGTLQAIGATTWEEYEKYIMPDRPLDRRFQPVIVGEPSKAETMMILQGLKKTYEKYHGVEIETEALEAAIVLSKKIKNRYLPDKAIDLIDEACAKAAIEASGKHRVAMGIVHGAAKKNAKKESKSIVTKKDIAELVKEWDALDD